MSEFSSSFHYFKKSQDEVVKLHSENGIKSYIFKQVGNWVTALVESSSFSQVRKINDSILLEYNNAEDHGWEIRLYNHNKTISVYNCMWGDDIVINDSHLNKDKLLEILEIDGTKLDKILYPQSFEQIFENSPAYSFAELVGLKFYSWLSYDYLDPDDFENELFNSDDFIVVK